MVLPEEGDSMWGASPNEDFLGILGSKYVFTKDVQRPKQNYVMISVQAHFAILKSRMNSTDHCYEVAVGECPMHR